MSILKEQYQQTKVADLFIPGHKYSLKIAGNRDEIKKALRLRFDVFNIELGEGLSESYHTQMDEDEFDAHCHHLIVVENETGAVIGTYRMQDNLMAKAGQGFYTQSEFDVNTLPNQILNNVVELGRACIHRDHRSGRVLYLLWRGLAKYLELSQKRYLFGCCSITSQNPAEGAAVFEFLKVKKFIHPEYQVAVQPEFECLFEASEHSFSEDVKIPQLFQLYLDIGTLVYSPPAIDRTFKTIDFLIILDVDTLSPQSKALFFR